LDDGFSQRRRVKTIGILIRCKSCAVSPQIFLIFLRRPAIKAFIGPASKVPGWEVVTEEQNRTHRDKTAHSEESVIDDMGIAKLLGREADPVGDFRDLTGVEQIIRCRLVRVGSKISATQKPLTTIRLETMWSSQIRPVVLVGLGGSAGTPDARPEHRKFRPSSLENCVGSTRWLDQ
jgi:hypothetical protein